MVGISYLELILYEANSLKDKRQVLQSIMRRLRQRFNISVSETGHHDRWKRIQMEIAFVARDKTGLEKVLQEVVSFIEKDGRVEILSCSFAYY